MKNLDTERAQPWLPWRPTHNAQINRRLVPLMAQPRSTIVDGRKVAFALFEKDAPEPSWLRFEEGGIVRVSETVGGMTISINRRTHGLVVMREDRHNPSCFVE